MQRDALARFFLAGCPLTNPPHGYGKIQFAAYGKFHVQRFHVCPFPSSSLGTWPWKLQLPQIKQAGACKWWVPKPELGNQPSSMAYNNNVTLGFLSSSLNREKNTDMKKKRKPKVIPEKEHPIKNLIRRKR